MIFYLAIKASLFLVIIYMSDGIFNELYFSFVSLNISNITTQKQTECYIFGFYW